MIIKNKIIIKCILKSAHLRLEDLDQLEFAATLHLETLQLSE